MIKIYSNVVPGLLIHAIYKMSDAISRQEERVDISPNEEFLQVSSLKLSKGRTFRPHKHIYQKREIDITQESWVVLSGSVRAILYDIDDTIIETIILNAGDCSITYGRGDNLSGGHNYECIEDAIILEYKNGPYLGQSYDKTFLNE